MTGVTLTSRSHKVSPNEKILESRRLRGAYRSAMRAKGRKKGRTHRTVVLAGTRGIWLSFWNMHRTCIVKHTHLGGHSAFVVRAEGSAATRSSGTSSIQTSTSGLMSSVRSAVSSDKQPRSRRAGEPRGVHRTRARARVYSRALPSTFTGDQRERIRSGIRWIFGTRERGPRCRADGGEDQERGRRDRPVQFPRGGSHYTTAAPTRVHVHSGSGSIARE